MTATLMAEGRQSYTDSAGNVATSSALTVLADYTDPTAATSLALAATGGTNQVANALNAGNTNFTVTATITGDVGSGGGTAELLVGGASFSTPITAPAAFKPAAAVASPPIAASNRSWMSCANWAFARKACRRARIHSTRKN